MLVSIFIILTFVKYICILSSTPRRPHAKPAAILSYSGLSFFSIITLTMFIQILCISDLCHRGYIHKTYFILFNELYSTQAVLLLMLWFIRINFVFNDTAFKSSKLSQIGFSIIVLFGLISTASLHASGLNETHKNLWVLLSLCVYSLYIIEVIYLSVLFGIKLYQIYGKNKNGTKGTDKLVFMITKIAILNFVSLFITFLAAMTVAAFGTGDAQIGDGVPIFVEFNAHFMILLDTFTNFMCVVLSYNYYGKYYKKICGCLHNRCSQCCYKIVGDNKKGNKPGIELAIQNAKSNSDITVGSKQSATIDTGTNNADLKNGVSIVYEDNTSEQQE